MSNRIPKHSPGRGDEDDDMAWLLLKLRGWLFMLGVFVGIVYVGYWVLRWSYVW